MLFYNQPTVCAQQLWWYEHYRKIANAKNIGLWGVMVEFEDVNPNKFAQLVADAPDWVEWMA
jgi:hypothetical protein